MLPVLLYSVSLAANRLELPVKVNGQVMRFALDTGTGAGVVLWSDVGRMLGVVPESTSSATPDSGRVAFSQSGPVLFEFLGRKFPGTNLALVDAPDYFKWEIQGLIGWPAVKDNFWKIDLGRTGCSLLGGVPEEARSWLRFRLAKEEVLALEVPREGRPPGILVVDTGARGGLSLAPALWSEWKKAHPGEPAALEASVMLADGVSVSEVAAAGEWTLGGLTLGKVLLQQAHPSELASHGPNYVGTLGWEALRKLTVVVDGKEGWAYLRAHEESPALGDYNRLGAVFVPARPEQDGPLFARVAPGGPAEEAGLRDGDRLLGLNGWPVSHWRERPGSWPLASFYSQPPGARIELKVERNGRALDLRPALRELLAPPDDVRPRRAFDAPLNLPFHFLPALADLLRRGADAGIATGQIVMCEEGGSLRKGDRVVALITCADDDRFQQWLALFAANDLKPDEKRKVPKLATLYTPSGRTLHFDPAPAGVAIHVVGPLAGDGSETKVRDEWSGAIVTSAFLSQGFDGTARVLRRFGSIGGGMVGFNSKPYERNDGAEIRTRLEAEGIGEAEERAFVASSMALAEFFRIAAQTPGIRNVLERMLDLSWKDILKNPRVNIDLQPPVENLMPEIWGLPGEAPCQAFRFRIDLNGKPRIMCRVAVTPPVRPLQTIGGIVGIVASRADGGGPHVMVRVLSAEASKE